MYVRTSRYATTGRSGLGLLRDDEVRAPQSRLSEELNHEYHRSRRRARPSWPGRLTRYAIEATSRPPLGGFPTLLILGRVPEPGHPPSDLPGAGAPRPLWGAGLSRGSVRWRTRRRMEAGGPGRATGRDSFLHQNHANVPSMDFGAVTIRRLVSIWNAQRAKFEYLQ